MFIPSRINDISPSDSVIPVGKYSRSPESIQSLRWPGKLISPARFSRLFSFFVVWALYSGSIIAVRSECLGLLVTFLIGLIYGIKFMIQAKTQDKEEYERKKAKDELDYKETELRYKKLLEDKR